MSPKITSAAFGNDADDIPPDWPGLSALDVQFGDLRQPTQARLERATQDRVLAKAALIGTYEQHG